jgi:dipeptidyl aminopeptidase/acylaminoacyl peptidase
MMSVLQKMRLLWCKHTLYAWLCACFRVLVAILALIYCVVGGMMATATAAQQNFEPQLRPHITPQRPTLSPDGQQIAWLEVEENAAQGPRRILVLATIKQHVVRTRTVVLEGLRVQALSWDRLSSMLYLRADRVGDEIDRVFVVDVDGGAPKDLTPALQGRVRLVSPLSGPEGQLLLMHTPTRGASVRLLALDPATGIIRDRTPAGPAGWFVADDKGLPALVLRPSATSLVWQALAPDATPGPQLLPVVSAADGTTEPINVVTRADGMRYALFMDAGAGDFPVLKRINLQTAAQENVLTPASPPPRRVLFDEAGEVLAYIHEHLRPEWVILEPSLEPHLNTLKAQGGFPEVLARTRAERWLVRLRFADQPERFAVYETSTQRLMPLQQDGPSPVIMPGKTIAAMIRARDGLMLPAYLTLPATTDKSGAPLVLLIHGGPWRRDQIDFDRQVSRLVERGYSVLRVNYRSSTGFGNGHVLAGDGQWSGAVIDDLVDAVAWAQDQPGVAATPPAVVGGSFGGFAALMLMAREDLRPRCAVAIAAATDLGSFANQYAQAEPNTKARLIAALGPFDNDEQRTRLAMLSPIGLANRMSAPILLIHGENDARAPITDVRAFARKASQHAPVTLAVAAQEGHSFAAPITAQAANQLQQSFLDRCMGRAPAGLSTATYEGLTFEYDGLR